MNSLVKKLLCFIILTIFAGFSIATTKHNLQKTKHHTHTMRYKKHKYTHGKTPIKSTYPVASITSKVPSKPVMVDTNHDTPIEAIDMTAVANQPRLYSYSALAITATNGKVLISKNPNTRLPIASISKLMTAIVVLDSKADLDEYVTITDADIDTVKNTPSRLRVGMALRRKDLLLLALMSSENRAAHALGRTTYAGKTPEFVKKMNEKCIELGMTNTKFYDTSGLSNANQSTAQDLAKMVQTAFTYEIIRHDTTTKSADVQLGKHYIHHYLNSDALVRTGKMQIGLSKTGFINEAGHCLVLYSIIDKQPIIMVFLNSSGKSGRLIDAIAVNNYVKKIS